MPVQISNMLADGGPFSLLRLLANFSSIGSQGRTMSQVYRRLEQGSLALNDIKHHKSQITFSDIREVLLNLDDLPAFKTSSFRDLEHWDVATGNLGYVRHDEFVCLTNILSTDSSVDLCAEPTELLDVHCDPPRSFTIKSISDDWDRYFLFGV